jgi:hypothetical protein
VTLWLRDQSRERRRFAGQRVRRDCNATRRCATLALSTMVVGHRTVAGVLADAAVGRRVRVERVAGQEDDMSEQAKNRP